MEVLYEVRAVTFTVCERLDFAFSNTGITSLFTLVECKSPPSRNYVIWKAEDKIMDEFLNQCFVL